MPGAKGLSHLRGRVCLEGPVLAFTGQLWPKKEGRPWIRNPLSLSPLHLQKFNKCNLLQEVLVRVKKALHINNSARFQRRASPVNVNHYSTETGKARIWSKIRVI